MTLNFNDCRKRWELEYDTQRATWEGSQKYVSQSVKRAVGTTHVVCNRGILPEDGYAVVGLHGEVFDFAFVCLENNGLSY